MATDTPRSDAGTGQSSASTGTSATSGSAAGRNDPDLQVQVARLREDVAGLKEALQSKGASGSMDAKARAYELRDDVREKGERYYKQAQDAAHDLEDQMSEKVRAEPIKSLAIAAAVGYLYARLFR